MVLCKGSSRLGGASEGNRFRRTKGLALLHMLKYAMASSNSPSAKRWCPYRMRKAFSTSLLAACNYLLL